MVRDLNSLYNISIFVSKQEKVLMSRKTNINNIKSKQVRVEDRVLTRGFNYS